MVNTVRDSDLNAFDSVGKVILRVDDVHKTYQAKSRGKRVSTYAVRGVSISVHEGESVAIVGESGCGKTTIARMLVGLEIPTRGAISFEGVKLNPKKLDKSVRKKISMVFQDPYSSLNPRLNTEAIISEPMHLLSDIELSGAIKQLADNLVDDELNIELNGYRQSKQVSRKKMIKIYSRLLMNQVQLRSAWAHRYPHEFSGGQRQRIGIARALATQPDLLILDEPVSALDVSVQAGIINLLKSLNHESNLTTIFISHDLRTVSHVCDRVIVMYLGQIMEDAPKDIFFSHPRHPYTRALLQAVPTKIGRKSLDEDSDSLDKSTLLPFLPIRGEIPSSINPPTGCPFKSRCDRATDICNEKPPLAKMTDGRLISCHFPY